MNSLRQAYTALEQFFYREESAKKVAIFRILLGIVLLLNQGLWLFNLRAYFSNQGFISSSVVQNSSPPETFSLFFGHDSLGIIVVAYIVLVMATLAFTAGYRPRPLTVLILILTVSFNNRDPYLFHAGDMVLRITLFYTMFLNTGQALVWKPFRPEGKLRKTVEGWPVRLIQIQLTMLYLFAGISKLHGSQWSSGQYVYEMLNYPGRGFFDTLWLNHWPVIVALMTYGVMFAELSFAFLVWHKTTRRWAVFQIAMVHIGILLTFNTVYFSEIMLVVLTLFLTVGEMEKIGWLVREGFVRGKQLLVKKVAI